MADDLEAIQAAIDAGDADAAQRLLPLVYDELRGLAHHHMRREKPGQSLQTTALVHEAYLRLLGPRGQAEPDWRGRGHFLAAPAQAMRHILVDRARAARPWRGISEEVHALRGGIDARFPHSCSMPAPSDIAMIDPRSLERIFHASRELPAGPEREAFLEDACAGDAGLRAKVDALLRADVGATHVFGGAEGPHDHGQAAATARDEVAGDLDRYRRYRRQPDSAAQDAGSESVLQVLQAQAKVHLGVHLDAPGQEDAPVKVTEEVKALRDPSGRYHLLGEIGRGGVGVVYKGRDQDLGRDVAIKVLKDEYARKPELLARFVEEAQVGGQLQHPGIVPVYELGLQAGERPYFAMKLVKGETLSAQLTRRADLSEDRRRLLGVFEQICQTIAYAHARRVVHRDLKPANVMIGAFGEVQVVDWGLSKVLPAGGVVDESASEERAEELSVIDTVRTGSGSGSGSLAGSRIGTPAYMPPEQAQGEIERVDQRSDVFGLGAILCEILTGAPPYRKGAGDLLWQAAMGALDETYERLRGCGADKAVVSLCIDCLARLQSDRPASAAQVAERVSAYLTSVEERARTAELEAAEARVRAGAERKARRLTVALASSGLALVAVVAGVYVRGVQQEEARVVRLRSRLDEDRREAMALQAGGKLVQALSVARRSSALAEAEQADAGARAEASALLASIGAALEREERRDELLAHVERIRTLETGRIEEVQEAREQVDAAYADAFRSLGLDLEGGDPTAAIEELRAADHAQELAIALDDWGRLRRGLFRPADEASLELITGFACDLDDHERRIELRQALLAEDAGVLLELAKDEECLADPWTLVVLVEGLGELGQTKQARTLADRAARLYPDGYRLRWSAGWSHFKPLDKRMEEAANDRSESRPDLALPHYAAALALRPDDPAALVMVAMAEFELGEIVEARAHLRRVVDMELERYRAWGALSGIELTLGEFESAVRHLERAVEGWPAPSMLRERLALARHLAGELSEDEYEAALEPFGPNPWLRILPVIHGVQPMDESRVSAVWERVEEWGADVAGVSGYWFARAIVALRADRPVEAVEAVARWARMDQNRKPLQVAAMEFVAAIARQRLGEAEVARERYDGGRAVLEKFARGREEQLVRSYVTHIGEQARVELGL